MAGLPVCVAGFAPPPLHVSQCLLCTVRRAPAPTPPRPCIPPPLPFFCVRLLRLCAVCCRLPYPFVCPHSPVRCVLCLRPSPLSSKQNIGYISALNRMQPRMCAWRPTEQNIASSGCSGLVFACVQKLGKLARGHRFFVKFYSGFHALLGSSLLSRGSSRHPTHGRTVSQYIHLLYIGKFISIHL